MNMQAEAEHMLLIFSMTRGRGQNQNLPFNENTNFHLKEVIYAREILPHKISGLFSTELKSKFKNFEVQFQKF